jgi:hypothetical protein
MTVTLTSVSTGEKFNALNMTFWEAQEAGLCVSQYIHRVLFVRRQRGDKVPIEISPGEILTCTEHGTQRLVRAYEFQAVRRYQGQKHMDSGYLVLDFE